MKSLILVPALLLAACGDNLHPDEDQLADTTEGDPTDGPDTPDVPPDMPPDTPGFFAFFLSEPADCSDHSVRLEGHYGYVDGPSVPENVICRYELADGTVLSDSCFARPSLPTPELVIFTVTDPATGAFASHMETVQGPATFGATADVTSSGLAIAWDAHTSYGGVADVGSVRVTITPSENVIIANPDQMRQLMGTVNVTTPGTYTVSVFASISFGEVGGCGAVVEKTIDVTCAGDARTH